MDELKERGIAEHKAGNYEKAIIFFTASIELGGDHVLYSDRSACYAGLGKWGEALKDAESCIKMAPTWPNVRLAYSPGGGSRPSILCAHSAQGFERKGAALYGPHRFDEAIAAYEEGLKIDPANEMLSSSLADVKMSGVGMSGVEIKVKGIIAKQLGVKAYSVKLDSSFTEDLDVDSLIMAIEEAFDIKIPDEKAKTMTTPAECVAAIIMSGVLRHSERSLQ